MKHLAQSGKTRLAAHYELDVLAPSANITRYDCECSARWRWHT